MSIKSSVLGAVALALVCFTTVVSSAIDYGCDFITFGQDLDVGDAVNCAALSIKGDKNCCYNALRKPYCCETGSYVVNIILWIVAIVAVICSIIIFIRRVFFYRRIGILFL